MTGQHHQMVHRSLALDWRNVCTVVSNERDEVVMMDVMPIREGEEWDIVSRQKEEHASFVYIVVSHGIDQDGQTKVTRHRNRERGCVATWSHQSSRAEEPPIELDSLRDVYPLTAPFLSWYEIDGDSSGTWFLDACLLFESRLLPLHVVQCIQ